MAGRKLEVALLQELEAELAADRVRGRVLDRREGMEVAVLSLPSGQVDRLLGRFARYAAALELRQHRPAGLVDGHVPPVLLPVADRAGGLAARLVHDLEHPARPGAADPLVAALALGELLLALRPAEVLGHGRIAHEPAEQGKVALAPRLKPHTPPFGHRRWIADRS